MPTYSFIDTNTGEEFSEFMSMSELETFLMTNEHIQQTILNSNLVTKVGGLKPADGFKDVLKAIKKSNPGSTIEV
jgi:predicted nucleic acid-binding Zn ribbon protein